MAALADFVNAYNEVWETCPYTSLKMFETILHYNYGAGTGLRIYMDRVAGRPRGNVTLADLEIGGVPGRGDNAFLEPLWNSRSGLCTSFTIKTYNQVPADAANPFIYGNGRNHRLGWRMDRIVVDSSERQAIRAPAGGGAFVFAADGPLTRTKNGVTTTYERILTWQDAMIACLRQLLRNSSYIVLFRALKNNGGRVTGAFAGRIDWDIGWRTCVWSVQIRGGPAPRFNKGVAFFGAAGGNAHTNQQCLDSFEEFLDDDIDGAGGTREDQYEDVRAFHNTLWAECIEKFGNPTFTWRGNVA